MNVEDKNKKEKILVVDDEPVIRELLVNFLQREGYTVDCAGNGVEALKVLKKDT
ncbi:MAG: response regulator, partial [Nitrospinota bacterium]|nr:response regulator [Nitrospinota bacterium]